MARLTPTPGPAPAELQDPNQRQALPKNQAQTQTPNRTRTTRSEAHHPEPGPEPPALSVILLTLDEEDNIVDALNSLTRQEDASLEILVIDAASQDDTVARAKPLAEQDPRIRIDASDHYLSVGQARNRGLRQARSQNIAFMSADATAAPGWARAAIEALQAADIVYGRQEHTPDKRTIATLSRGMRYHHFQDDHERPAADYASNVNAAVRRDVFDQLRYVDDGPASALDDILFTREAETLGYKIAYRRDMQVDHKDSATIKDELVKNRREGLGWGLLAPQLGLNMPVVLWGVAGALALAATIAMPQTATLALLLLVVWAPALRRASRSLGVGRRARLTWLGAVLLSPLFDLVFLFAYLAGLRRRRGDLSGLTHPQGALNP